jgi:ATP-dependent DNA helicase RecQ
VAEIATVRGLKDSTIYGHLEEAIRAGEAIEMNRLIDEQGQREIASAFARHGFGNLTGAVESLAGRYSHGQLRVYRALAQSAA